MSMSRLNYLSELFVILLTYRYCEKQIESLPGSLLQKTANKSDFKYELCFTGVYFLFKAGTPYTLLCDNFCIESIAFLLFLP